MELIIAICAISLTVTFGIVLAVGIEKGKPWAYEITKSLAMIDPHATNMPPRDPGEPSVVSKEPSAAEKEPSATGKEPSAAEKEPSATGKEPSTTEEDPSARQTADGGLAKLVA